MIVLSYYTLSITSDTVIPPMKFLQHGRAVLCAILNKPNSTFSALSTFKAKLLYLSPIVLSKWKKAASI